jgi:hypothetical protein
MPLTKQLADLITWSRCLAALVLAWLGAAQGMSGLPLAVWLMLASWTGDIIDGPLARNSIPRVQTWIGEHDLQVDILVASGLLAYMTESGFVSARMTGAYLALWALIVYRFGLHWSLGMLFQAPIYAWFIWISLIDASHLGWWLVAWIGTAVAATWPRFPQEIVPEFLAGMRHVWERQQRGRNGS